MHATACHVHSWPLLYLMQRQLWLFLRSIPVGNTIRTLAFDTLCQMKDAVAAE